jgi:hypothetical protein
MRRDGWISKIDWDNDKFNVLDNGGNDSLAFKVSQYDFRGEAKRDKSLDITDKPFKTSNFLTSV